LLAGDRGLKAVFDHYNLDILMTSVEKAQMTDMAVAMNYPAVCSTAQPSLILQACVPLGYMDDGEPFGLLLIARPWQEGKLIAMM
jgi:Asp-tRNA(Asn)/Glu-tRNA(Gln) amidotransferase A subunit family amidase